MDGHNRLDKISDRQEHYIPVIEKFELRMHMWFSVKLGDYNKLVVAHKEALKEALKEGEVGVTNTVPTATCHNYTVAAPCAAIGDEYGNMMDMVEFHVIFLPIARYGEGKPSVRFDASKVDKVQSHFHEADVCNCDKRMVNKGQDE